MKLSDFLFNIGRPVAFYPGLVKALGSMKQAVFICQMAYWKDKGGDPDGWIYKTAEEIEAETSLTYKEQTTVRAALVEKGALQERYARTEHQMYFRVDWDVVNALWDEHLTNGQVLREVGHLTNGKVAPYQRSGGTLPKVSSLNSNTENTQKNTQRGRENPALNFKDMTIPQARKIPTLKMYADATGWFPADVLWEKVHNFISENKLTEEKIRAAAVAWVGKGYKRGNVMGILEWALDGAPVDRNAPSSPPVEVDPFASLKEHIARQEAHK